MTTTLSVHRVFRDIICKLSGGPPLHRGGNIVNAERKGIDRLREDGEKAPENRVESPLEDDRRWAVR